jgi:glycosyltransferase involved in cell wall biosynthesis
MTVEVHQFFRKPYPGTFSIERVFADIDAALPEDITVQKIENRHYSRGVLQRLWDIMLAWRQRGPVNHVLGDVHYLTFLLPRRSTILTIHDCDMINRNSGLKRFILKFFWLDLPLRKAGFVVAISKQTRDDIISLSGMDKKRIRVIDNPLSSSFQPMPQSYKKGEIPTVLHIGTKANKNLERLVQAAIGMPIRLLIVGHPNDVQRRLLETSGVDYEFRADLSDDEILSCYAEAQALSFISLSEGFGLPIIEAQAVGRPVITSNREPMRSVAGDTGALLVDPENISDIRSGLERILSDTAFCTTLVENGAKNAERFRAQRIANRYARLYRAIARKQVGTVVSAT